MAVWKGTVAGFPVVIHSVDHPPPHCHVFVQGRDVRVALQSMEPLNRKHPRLTPALKRGLTDRREELLKAWSEVVIIDPGRHE